MQVLLAENEIADVKGLVRSAGTGRQGHREAKISLWFPSSVSNESNCRAGRKGLTEIACEPGLQEFHEPVSASWDREMIRDCGGKRNFSRGRIAKSTYLSMSLLSLSFSCEISPLGSEWALEFPSWILAEKTIMKTFYFCLLYWVKCVFLQSSIRKPLWRSGAGLFFEALKSWPWQCETIVTLPLEPVYSSIKKK